MELLKKMPPSNFFEYEKQNNRLIRSLRENKQFSSVVGNIIEKDAILLFPHDQSVALCLSNINNSSLFKKSSPNSIVAPSIDFLQSHIAIVNKQNPNQFITMNGIRGVFAPDGVSILIIDGPPTGEECIAFFEEPSKLFTFRKM